MVVDGAAKKMSDKDVIDLLFEKDSTIRVMQLVIDWLEKNERDDMDSEQYSDKIEFYSEGPHCWENTLHQNKIRSMRGEKSKCLDMDPDACIRTNVQLNDLDKEDENRLTKHIFKYLRAGRLEVGKSIAEKLGYHWLSAALEGWILHHDFNFDEGLTEGGSMQIIQGNANRDLWKYTCFKYAHMKNVSQSPYEAAIFGVLSGNIQYVLPLLNRWSDKLWIYFKASLDVQIENELRHTSIQNIVTSRGTGNINSFNRTSVELPNDYWNNSKNFVEIFREVDAAINNEELLIEERCHQNIQKFIILESVDSTLEFMVDWIRENTDKEIICPHMCRFFCHLLLFFSQIDLINTESRKGFAITILEEYINYLIEWKEIELVAYYVAHLPPAFQVSTYAKLLEKINDKNQKQLCLKYAKEAKLDVENIIKKVVDTIRTESGDGIGVRELTTLPSDLKVRSEEDNIKIEALDWLFIDEIQYLELLLQSNALLRQFILASNIDSAKVTFKKLPANLIDGSIQNWRKKSGDRKISNKVSNAIKEHLCHAAHINAINSFDEWLQFYHNFKPQEPKTPSSNRFTDKVAFQHAYKQYEVDLDQWKSFLGQQAKLTADKIFKVLCFPDGGWMIDDKEDMEEDSERKAEMSNLRKLIIPQLTFILHSVLHSSNRLKECLEISNIIASKTFNLYLEFTQEQIKVLLHKFRETSTVLLDQATDGFGYGSE